MRRIVFIALCWILWLITGVSWANTITVLKDGSGDYTLLQPAADAAAPGDTLLIGPGRYEEVTDFAFNSGVPRDAHLVVRVDNLTILGMDRDAVIIGPIVPAIAQNDPVGLVVAENVTVTHIEKLTFENTWIGVDTLGDFHANDCVIRFCTDGFETFGLITIENCNMHNNENGAIILTPTGLASISHCELADNSGIGISLNSTQEARISDTHIVGGGAGIQFDNCPGFVKNCVIEHMAGSGITVMENRSVVTIAGNVLRDNLIVQIDINSFATVDMHRNKLLDSSLYGIWIRSPSTVHINENDLISPQGYLAYLTGHLAFEIVHYDFTNNYWGTIDPQEIADRIWDNHDFISTRAIIDFEPFAEEPVPAKSTSFGELKASFGNR